MKIFDSVDDGVSLHPLDTPRTARYNDCGDHGGNDADDDVRDDGFSLVSCE